MTSIVIVENQTLVREGIRALLEREKDFRVIGEAADGQVAVQVIEELKPDVVLMELLVPELHGLDLLRRIKVLEGTRAIVLTSHSNASYVIESLKIGASGYVLKDNCAADLFQAIRSATAGEHYLSRELRNCALELTIGRHGRNGKNGGEHITTRERVVLELAAEGLSNAEIASRLTISRRTVESHRASLMQKLGLKTQTELVRYAIRNQIINA
jgi:DNA-binding NarL/FixJ family response regulator